MIFKFLRYCLCAEERDMKEVATKMDWRQLYVFASKQALVAFCFDGIERLGKEYPDELKGNPIGSELLMTWMAKAQQIRRQNRKVNGVAARLYKQLREDGFRCCILKGQGNAVMYPNPAARTPGDIDIWVNAERKEIIEYAKGHFGLSDDIRIYHLETVVDGVPMELHFFPGVMNNPFYNNRLQKWFRRNVDLQCSNVIDLPDGAGEIAVPTTVFNVIYQLAHLYHHFFDEGIGMRQIIDYYLNIEKLKYGNTSDIERLKDLNIEILQRELKYLGLWKFAGAVMYVLHVVLELPEERMIRSVDVKRGELLLSEILKGGNFGKFFVEYGGFVRQGMMKKYFLKCWRNMHFLRYYPAEAICEPGFRLWHFLWRKFI